MAKVLMYLSAYGIGAGTHGRDDDVVHKIIFLRPSGLCF